MKHALVVEDNPLIAMMIEEELAEHGYHSFERAASQEEAIRMAQARCPDLITVDDQLDSGTGVDTIREICRDRTIPVIFITAEGLRITAAMPDAIVVPKPFSRAQLLAAISAAISAPMSCSIDGG